MIEVRLRLRAAILTSFSKCALGLSQFLMAGTSLSTSATGRTRQPTAADLWSPSSRLPVRRANPARWAAAASQLHRTVRNAHRARTTAVGIRAEDGDGRWISSGAIRLLTVTGVIVLYFVASATLLWPFVAHPRSTVTAPLGFDVTGSIAHFNAMAAEGISPFAGERLMTIGYPDGVPKRPAIHTASALSSGALWLGSVYLGAIPAHGLEALLGLFLTATVTFLFVRSVTGSTGAGFVSGVAYGFFPHMLGMARAAPTYTHMWLYVLPLWALTAVVLRPTRRRALLAGASVIPAMWWTPYYAEHVVGAFTRVRRRRGLSHQEQVGVAAALADDRLGRCPGCGGGISLGHARRVPGRGRRGAAADDSGRVLAFGAPVDVRSSRTGIGLAGQRSWRRPPRIPRTDGAACRPNRQLPGMVGARFGGDWPDLGRASAASAALAGTVATCTAGRCRPPRGGRRICVPGDLRATDRLVRAFRRFDSNSFVADRALRPRVACRLAVRHADYGRRFRARRDRHGGAPSAAGRRRPRAHRNRPGAGRRHRPA